MEMSTYSPDSEPVLARGGTSGGAATLGPQGGPTKIWSLQWHKSKVPQM